MSQTLNAKIKITAIDGASGVFGRVAANARRAHGAIGGMGAGGGKRFLAGTAGFVGLGIAAHAAGRAIAGAARDFMAWESALTDFGKVVNLQGAALDSIGDTFRDMAPPLGQTSDAILAAANVLAGKGLDLQRTTTAMTGLSRVATATGASMEDVANSAFVMMDTMGVSAGRLEQAFDKMAQAGKMGGFELKDMAQFLPELAASAKAMGMAGEDGVARLTAMLQVAMKTAGSTSQAATNTRELMSKLVSGPALNKIKALGIDPQKIRNTAKKTGEDFTIALVKAIHRKTKGDPFLVNKVFQELNSRLAFQALSENLDLAEEIYQKARKAQGVVAKDFDLTMTLSEKRWQRFTANLDRASKTAGEALWKGGLGTGLDAVNRYLESISGTDMEAFFDRLAGGFATAGNAAKLYVETVHSIHDTMFKLAGLDMGDSLSRGFSFAGAEALRFIEDIHAVERELLLLKAVLDDAGENAPFKKEGWRFMRWLGVPGPWTTKGVPEDLRDSVDERVRKTPRQDAPSRIDTFNWPLRGGSPPTRPRIERLPGSPLAAVIEGPVTAELKGEASVNVTVRVDGPGRVTSIGTTASGHLARPNVGTDLTGVRDPAGRILGRV